MKASAGLCSSTMCAFIAVTFLPRSMNTIEHPQRHRENSMKLRAAAALLVTFLTANALGRQTENAIVIEAKDSTPARDSDHRRRDRHCRCVRWSSAGFCAAARKHVVVCKRNDRAVVGVVIVTALVTMITSRVPSPDRKS